MTTALRPVRGRESTLAKRAAELGMETTSLRSELREVGGLLPHARAVHLYILRIGESIEAVQSASHIAYHIERVARRHGK